MFWQYISTDGSMTKPRRAAVNFGALCFRNSTTKSFHLPTCQNITQVLAGKFSVYLRADILVCRSYYVQAAAWNRCVTSALIESLSDNRPQLSDACVRNAMENGEATSFLLYEALY